LIIVCSFEWIGSLISLISVYYEINHYAESQGSPRIELGDAIFGAAKNLSKGYNNVRRLCLIMRVQMPRAIWNAPFFVSLKTYLLNERKGHGYAQAILDVPLLDAKEIHAALV